MGYKVFRYVAFLAIISIVGIATIQIIWFKKAFDLKEKQFTHNVTLALQNTAESILSYQHLPVPLDNIVFQVSGNYFVVSINGNVEISVLGFLLKKEFEKRNLLVDFEFGKYNCETKQMEYGNYVSFDKNVSKKTHNLPVWEKENYDFGVYFPNKRSDIFSQLPIWLFLSVVLLIVCFFVSYTIIVIYKQNRLSELQTDFINNMTHELKTPLSTIQVTTDLLRKPEVYQNINSLTNYLSIINFETKRLRGHIDRVLQISELEREKIDFNLQITNIHACIVEAIKSLELLLNEKNGKIEVSLNAEKHLLKTDEVHFTNIIYNLIENAIKYSKNVPEVKIITENRGKYLIVRIIDNGVGIDQEFHSKIFEKFFRIPSGDIHNVKGFGLGLFYVKNIVKAHKGSILVNSKPNEGTEFIINLPL